jgi:quinoprotein glucose dehydrogenase
MSTAESRVLQPSCSRLRWVASWVPTLSIAAAACAPNPPVDLDDPSYREWRVYHGDKAGTHYSALDQINVDNVEDLEVAWTFSTGDLTARRSEIQCNPIIVETRLYCTSAQGKAFAVHAATGELLWMYDPFEGIAGAPGTNRGVVYWDDGGEDKRILFAAGSMLHAIDAMTGEPIEQFGMSGRVDLKQGLGREVDDLYVAANTPGIIYGDLIIQGTRVGEALPAAPGHIRAYDVRTGEMAWIFHTIPQPGEFGYETWPPEAYTYIGGANNWSGMSLDEERGIVFVPTGSAAFDFHGGNRLGENLFANSVIALDAATGERVWHYQTVRHDIWDYDLPAPPNLVTIRRDGRWVDAVAQITKTGHIFVFDRDTGEPLFPIEEVEVPPSDLIGEVAWSTQPLPVIPAPFQRQEFTEAMITKLSPESHAAVLERFRQSRAGGIFIPPSVGGTVVFPGFNGGAEWGGASFDVQSGILYVNSTEMPWLMTMVGIPPEDEDSGSIGERVYTLNCASCHGADRGGDAQGVFPSLQGVASRYNREEIAEIIGAGRGFMPSFGHLSDTHREALVSFLLDPAEGGVGPSAAPAPESPQEASGAAVPYTHTGYHRFLDPNGYPAIEPPWGTLSAIDLSTGAHLWTVPLGEFEELTAAGLPPTGTENYGGSIVTAGGLLFIGATADEKFRAFDKRTGEVLWETDLPAGGYATPATYEIDGKQFVVIAAGGGKMGTPSGDQYVAFALPDR